MQRSKADAYVGLCRKAGKLTCGFNAVEVQRGGVYLVVVCSTAAPNTFKAAVKFSGRFKCPLMICRCGLEEAVRGLALRLNRGVTPKQMTSARRIHSTPITVRLRKIFI